MSYKLEYRFYNEDQKQEYITKTQNDNKKLSDGLIERVFTKTCPYEEELEKDISLFTTGEIQSMYKRMNFSSIDVGANFNSQLSIYTSWCLGLGRVPDCQNHFVEIRDYKPYVDSKEAKRKVISREVLLQNIDKLDNPCDAFALLAIFEGINGKERIEILNVHTTDFQEDGTIILHGDIERRIPVSYKLKEFAFDSAATASYRPVSGSKPLKLRDDDPTLVIKHFMAAKEGTSTKLKGRRIFFRLQKCLDMLGLDISITSISDSGKIHLLNELAVQNNMSGLEALYDPDISSAIERQFNCKMARAAFKYKYGQYFVAKD